MRETVGNTFIFKLIIVFTLLFSAFLALAISYNKVFRMKNQVISIIENYEGINDNTLSIINNYLDANGYKTQGECPDGFSGAKDFSGTFESASSEEKYYYCIKESNVQVRDENKYNKYRKIYNLIIFYKFNLPMLGDFITFKIEGQTKTITIDE